MSDDTTKKINEVYARHKSEPVTRENMNRLRAELSDAVGISSGSSRDSLPTGMRFRILNRDDFTCLYCGARPGNDRLHVDHLLPWSMGGANSEANLVASCERCNIGKSARVVIPKRLLAITSVDESGFFVWKQFGPWNIEVFDGEYVNESFDKPASGVIVHYPAIEYWFHIERCYEQNWVEHIEGKTWATLDIASGLDEALRFARTIYRKNHRR